LRNSETADDKNQDGSGSDEDVEGANENINEENAEEENQTRFLLALSSDNDTIAETARSNVTSGIKRNTSIDV